MCSLAAVPACRLLRIPLIDGTIRSGVAPRRVVAGKLCQRAAALVVANSRAGLRAWGVGEGKGRVIYNGLDPERLDHRLAVHDRPERPWTVVMTGRMTPQKDFASLITAAREVDAGDPGGWRFLLVGDGPDRQRLATLAGDLVDRGTVEFVDGGVDVMPFVRTAHCGVLMSQEPVHLEGCSNAIMEYMACGLPVICSAGGGNPELVVDGVTGSLVPAGDWRALADRLRGLRDGRDTAQAMGAVGLRRVREQFSAEQMVKRWLKVYGEVAWSH